MAGAVRGAHQAQAQLLDAGAGEREADQAARMAGHEVDRLGGGELGGDDEIALVLAVLVIDQDEHPPGPRLLDELLDGGEGGMQRGGGLFHALSIRRAT